MKKDEIKFSQLKGESICCVRAVKLATEMMFFETEVGEMRSEMEAGIRGREREMNDEKRGDKVRIAR